MTGNRRIETRSVTGTPVDLTDAVRAILDLVTGAAKSEDVFLNAEDIAALRSLEKALDIAPCDLPEDGCLRCAVPLRQHRVVGRGGGRLALTCHDNARIDFPRNSERCPDPDPQGECQHQFKTPNR